MCLLACVCSHRESLGDHISLYQRFLSFDILTPFIFVISMLDIIAHRLLLGAYSVCMHHDSVFRVSFHPIRLEGSNLEGHLYLEVHIYLEAYICLEDSSPV